MFCINVMLSHIRKLRSGGDLPRMDNDTRRRLLALLARVPAATAASSRDLGPKRRKLAIQVSACSDVSLASDGIPMMFKDDGEEEEGDKEEEEGEEDEQEVEDEEEGETAPEEEEEQQIGKLNQLLLSIMRARSAAEKPLATRGADRIARKPAAAMKRPAAAEKRKRKLNETFSSSFYGSLKLCLYSQKSYIERWNGSKWRLWVNCEGFPTHNAVCRAVWAKLKASPRALSHPEVIALRNDLRRGVQQEVVPLADAEPASRELHAEGGLPVPR